MALWGVSACEKLIQTMTSTCSQDLSIVGQKLCLVLGCKFRHFLLLFTSGWILSYLSFVCLLQIFLLNHSSLFREWTVKSSLTCKGHLFRFLLCLDLGDWLLALGHLRKSGLLLHLLQSDVLLKFLWSELLLDCFLLSGLETIVYYKGGLVDVQICLWTVLVTLLVIQSCSLLLHNLALELNICNRSLYRCHRSADYSLMNLQLRLLFIG